METGANQCSVRDVVIAVDLGGTNLRVALVDRMLRIIQRHEEPTCSESGPAAILDRIRRHIGTHMADGNVNVNYTGIAIAGIVDAESGVVCHGPNLPGWEGVPVREEIEHIPECPAVVGNDADLAAMAEAHVRGVVTGSLLYVTVSTGIGGGLVCRGESFMGGRDLSLEIGHIVVMVDGPMCPHGGRGCLEALASGTAIAREATEAAKLDRSSPLAMYLKRHGVLDAQGVAALAYQGDQVALSILSKAGYYLGMGLSSLAHLFSPDLIVVGGGVSNVGDLLLAGARQAFVTQTMRAYAARVEIVPAALGGDSSLLGAAQAAWYQVALSRSRSCG